MNNISKNALADGKFVAWYSLFVLVIIVLFGLFIGQALGLLMAIFISHLKLSQVPMLATPPFSQNERIPLFLLQGMGTLFGFFLAGLFYIRFFERVSPFKLFKMKGSLSIVILSVIMVVAFMFANSFLIDWNAHLHFPAEMKGFETWARSKENELKVMTDFLTEFNSTGDFILGFVVIVLIPAFGEELLFRGIIQDKLENLLKNGHAAVWISAILFSAFHFQFFGFVPRIMLGVLFGYMYYWSRSLWYPVMAHFINNGFILVMMYLYDLRITNINVENEQAYSWTTTLIYALLGFLILFYFRRYFIQRNLTSDE